jgi:hypothetical protein
MLRFSTVAAAALLITGAQAQTLGLPELGLQTTGACRMLAVKDRSNNASVPIGCLDTGTHRFTTNALKVIYGAKLDGTTDDSLAFNAARSALGSNTGVVDVPAGTFNAAAPTGGPTAPILWRMFGNLVAGGAPVAGIGTDVVETFITGAGKFIGQTDAPVASGSAQPLMTVQRAVHRAGGDPGVMPTFTVNTDVANNSTTPFIWGLVSRISDSNTFTGGNDVAGYFQAVRSDGQVTLPRTALWASTFEARDRNNAPSSQTGPLLGSEVDIFGNNLDNANVRLGQDIVVGRHNTSPGYTMEAAYGSRVSSSSGDTANAWVKTGYGVTSGVADTAFSAAGAVFRSVPVALRTGANNYIDLSNDNSILLRHNVTALQYTAGGTLLFQLSDAGLGTFYNTLAAPGYSVAGVAGATCSGAPSASFAVTNGIVTHC